MFLSWWPLGWLCFFAPIGVVADLVDVVFIYFAFSFFIYLFIYSFVLTVILIFVVAVVIATVVDVAFVVGVIVTFCVCVVIIVANLMLMFSILDLRILL